MAPKWASKGPRSFVFNRKVLENYKAIAMKFCTVAALGPGNMFAKFDFNRPQFWGVRAQSLR